MSVNITVNGKFAEHCRNHPLLADPEVVRKAEEKERRKLRLLQVREKSKEIAKKIREDVNAEKKRELQKLQATKDREFECWREHALQRRDEEYRAAIFQIGKAHRAAKRENEKTASKETQPRGLYKDFRKQIAARKSQSGKVQFSCQPLCPCQNSQPGTTKQFKCTCTQTEDYSNTKNNANEVHKRKRDLSFSSSESECEDEGYKEQTTLHQSSTSLSSTSDISTTFSGNDHTTHNSMFVPTKNKCLIKTPAVYLDVEVGTDDSVTISAPVEVKDKNAECNRQFSSIIRVKPQKGRQQEENTSENTSFKQSSTTTTLSSDVTTKVQNPQNVQNNIQVSKDKRFTIISELVKKQHQNEENLLNASKKIIACPPNSQPISTTVTPYSSPKKQTRGAQNQPSAERPAALSPRKTSATSKSSRTTSTQPLKTLQTMTKINCAAASGSSGRVQFFDYNSKLAKEQDQAATTVAVERQRDLSQPSAMQHAAQENLKERERLLEELKKCQITEERGQKALEREQIRRDCNELTEKLDVLSREYANQLPTNENQLHIFADKQLRKEGKMNSAVEKLLQRPAIITCSEQNKTIENEIGNKQTRNMGNLLNVASLNNQILSSDDISSDSCCSILLGYVDDQSRLVKQDLENNEDHQNQSKQTRLKNLLKRLDELRNSLIQELRNESEAKSEKREKESPPFPSKEENLKQVIDSISAMRKEREQIMINENFQKPKQLLNEREKELQAKEALLERKVREFYELQQKQEKESQKNETKKDSQGNKISKKQTDERSTSNEKNKGLQINDKEKIVCTSREKPLEIIITVKGETKCVKIPQKPKRNLFLRKGSSKLSTLLKSPQNALTKAKNHTPQKKAKATKQLETKGVLRSQNSYDSNSTSYMSLPPELPTKIENLPQCILKAGIEQTNKTTKKSEIVNKKTPNHPKEPESETSQASLSDMPRFKTPPHINPLIAQYVQRLLGMSRDAVKKLGVSSSDIETPSSSIINTTENINRSDNIISDERLATLYNFIEENKSFIKDIEESIKSQNNVSLENSMRMLDDIWRQRLERENKKTQKIKNKQETNLLAKEKNIQKKSSLNKKEIKTSETSNASKTNKPPVTSKSKQLEPKTTSTDNKLKDFSKTLLSSLYSSDGKESINSLKIDKRPPAVKTRDKGINAKLPTENSKTESDSQIARYAKLTENCNNRIAELTELISRVRVEKQRLLEVTLSSVSDGNDRHSTEYIELPDSKSSTQNGQDDLTRASSSSSEENTQNKQTLSSTNSLHEMPKLSLADKNKHIANSRDSGIAESRPITSLEIRLDQEPISQTSSESVTAQAGVRKVKPPPTLKRFSPQLPEDELAHELSTIFEVDTPATSRINTAAGQSAEERENAVRYEPQQPTKFPTFEEYIKQLDLDIAQLGPEQSLQLQQEFISFLECLQQNRLTMADPPKYLEFPSINAYIQQLAESDLHLTEALEESLAKLHMSDVQPRNFPAVRQYIRHNKSKSLPSDEQQLLDTESLENITDDDVLTQTNSDDKDSDSMDVQEELKKRNIIKHSFRVSGTKKKHQQIFSSTAHKDATSFHQDILAAESGVDKLSTSGTSSDLLDSELKRMVQQWPGDMRKKPKDNKILSSTTTSTNVSALAHSASRAASLDNRSKDNEDEIKIRDFLTKELEKLTSNSSAASSTTTSDDSLLNRFLHSLIGSLTPRANVTANKSGGQTLERQKTSTPVPINSSQARSTTGSGYSKSASLLFSGESHLSSVNYPDRSIHFNTKEDNNADQSASGQR